MTFHDFTHANAEYGARQAASVLLLWLKTIAPIDGRPLLLLSLDLQHIAREMGWQIDEDDVVGSLIAPIPNYPFQPKESFEVDHAHVIAWMSSDKGFEDITAELYFTNGQWMWASDETIVKRPDLIHGVMPYPEPPVKFSKKDDNEQ